jgi:hypothetical protein
MAAGIIIASAAAAHRRAIEAADAAWAPYAKTHQMHHRPGRISWAHSDEPRVDGTFEGVSIGFELKLVPREWGMTAVAIPLSPVPVNVELSREGVLARIAKFFGAQDVVVGDEEFDRTYLIKATDEAKGRALLDAKVRKEILALGIASLAYDDGSVADHKAMVVVSVPRILQKPEEIDRLLELLVALAKLRPDVEPFR